MIMGVNLQILFFAGVIVLQVILITIIVRGFKIFERTVNFIKQEKPTVGTHSCKECKIEDKERAEVHIEGEEKEIKNSYQIPEEGEFLFMKQVELNKTDPVVEVNIIADRK